jgi:hypothetical protein
MLLISSSLALLVIYAGVKLLIQTKKELLGNLFRCAAWFFIIAGFLTLVCTGACCIAMCCKYGSKMMHKEHKMMGYGDEGMKWHFKDYNKMRHHKEYGGYCCSEGNCGGSGEFKCSDHSNACHLDTANYNRK